MSHAPAADEPGLAEMEARFRGASLSSSASSSSSSLSRMGAHPGAKRIAKPPQASARRPPSETAGSRGSSVASDVQICFDFTKNMCARGDNCRYSHDIVTIVNVNSQERGICFDFVRGQCNRGLLCRFSHDLSNLSQHQCGPGGNATHAAQKPGAICYDFVKGACSRGSGCRYSHDINSIASSFRAAPPRNEICYDYTRGRCTRGAACRYSHDPLAGTGGIVAGRGSPADLLQANAAAALQVDGFRHAAMLHPDAALSPSSTARLAQGMLMAVPPPRPPPPPAAERPVSAAEGRQYASGSGRNDVSGGGGLLPGPHNRMSSAWQAQQQQQLQRLIGRHDSLIQPHGAMTSVGYDSSFASVALTGALLGIHGPQPSANSLAAPLAGPAIQGPHALATRGASSVGSIGSVTGLIHARSSPGLGASHALVGSQIPALNSELPRQIAAVSRPAGSSIHSVHNQPPPPPPTGYHQLHAEPQAFGWRHSSEVAPQQHQKMVLSLTPGPQQQESYGEPDAQEQIDSPDDQTPMPPPTPPKSHPDDYQEDSISAPAWDSGQDANNGMSQSTLGHLREIWSRSG